MEVPKIYLSIDTDGEVRAIREDRVTQLAESVCNDGLVVLRITPFSDEARRISGKPGRVEQMRASEQEVDEEEEDAGAGTDVVELPYDVDWEEVR